MARVLARWWGRPIYAYATFLYLGLVLAVFVGNALAHRTGLESFAVFVAMIILIPVALVGARLLALVSFDRLLGRSASFWQLSSGGGDQWGGLLMILLASWPLTLLLGLPFLRFWDLGIVSILAGMAVTRIGCLLSGCCGGRPTSMRLGWRLANARGEVARRIPTQVIEGLCAAGFAAALFRFAGAERPAGLVACLGVASYSILRFLLEPLREEVMPLRIGLTLHQLLYAATALLALFVLGWCLQS